MGREQWKAVWRMIRIEKRARASKARREYLQRIADWGGTDEYEFRFVSYPGWGRP